MAATTAINSLFSSTGLRLGNLLKPAAVMMTAAVLAGCFGAPYRASDVEDRTVYEDKEVMYFGPDYLVSPGDQLEITYYIQTELLDEYYMEIGDQIRIEFTDYPAYDRTLNIRPDGRVTLPMKGDIMAVGKTPEQLAKDVDAVYSDYLRRPQSTVSLIRYGAKIRELKETIKTAPRGQSRLAVVQPDGKISLPLLQPFRAAGRTIGDVERVINESYGEIIPGMSTSGAILTATGNRIYIFGAVDNPGFYTLSGPTTAVQAIAMAGGLAPSANAASTLIITRDEKNRPVGQISNIKSLLDHGDLSQDVWLKQSDVVYVPTSWLGKAAIVGENIRRMIPIDFSFNYSIVDAVDVAGPNPDN